jgi:hypothetical protein
MINSNEIGDNLKKRLNEKMLLKNYGEYIKLVANAYDNAPSFEPEAVRHWKVLNDSNHKLWKRLLSKVNVIFVTEDKTKVGQLVIQGKEYPIEFLEGGQPYHTQPEMVRDYKTNGIIRINIDYSEHPIFSLEDNVVLRTIHDFIVHILGNHGFGGKGEIAAYNLHVKLAPSDAVPALFTEVVGQASFAISRGGFPEQKICILRGFDFFNLGAIDDDNYVIKDKLLIKKGETIKKQDSDTNRDDLNFKAIDGKHVKVSEPELELAHFIRESLRTKLY